MGKNIKEIFDAFVERSFEKPARERKHRTNPEMLAYLEERLEKHMKDGNTETIEIVQGMIGRLKEIMKEKGEL